MCNFDSILEVRLYDLAISAYWLQMIFISLPPNGRYAIFNEKLSAYVVKQRSKNSGQLQNSGQFGADQSSPLIWSFTVYQQAKACVPLSAQK